MLSVGIVFVIWYIMLFGMNLCDIYVLFGVMFGFIVLYVLFWMFVV